MSDKSTWFSDLQVVPSPNGWYSVKWWFKPPKGTKKLKKMCEYCPFSEKYQPICKEKI